MAMKHTFNTRLFPVNLRSLTAPMVGVLLTSIVIAYLKKPLELRVLGIVSACMILPRLLPPSTRGGRSVFYRDKTPTAVSQDSAYRLSVKGF
jgi:hypothetical protein